MRFRFAPSIANTIYALTAVLLSLMAAVTLANAFASWRAGSAIVALAEGYLPAYGMLARAHIRSLEQSFLLRRAVIAELEGHSADGTASDILAGEEAAGKAVETELQQARDAVLAQVAEDPAIADGGIRLGRLDAQIQSLQEDRARYGGLRKDLLAAIDSKDAGHLTIILQKLDAERDRLNDRLDQTRREMLTLAQDAGEAAEMVQWRVVTLTVVALAVSILLGLLLASRFAGRLLVSIRGLLGATKEAETGRDLADLPITSEDEIGELTRSFNAMLGQLRKKEKIRETFGKYVDPRLGEALIDRPEMTGSAGDRRSMTVLFCDMRGFTRLSHELTPASLVTLINRYFTVVSEEVRTHSGIVDKYIGDAMMAFWGPPFCAADRQATLACDAALAIVKRFESFRKEIPDLLGYRRFAPDVGIRIGIATGEVVVGNIGSAVTMNFTVMGEAVNIASRLEGINKLYATSILVNDVTAQMAQGHAVLREVDRVIPAGAEADIAVHELLAKNEDGAGQAQWLETYAAGLAAYRARDWKRARELLADCLVLNPADGPAATLLERIEAFLRKPPGASWSGNWDCAGAKSGAFE